MYVLQAYDIYLLKIVYVHLIYMFELSSVYSCVKEVMNGNFGVFISDIFEVVRLR
jgi:hypothetical protein